VRSAQHQQWQNQLIVNNQFPSSSWAIGTGNYISIASNALAGLIK
jgi:hypothetical protein